MKGIPIRIDLGLKDLDKKQITLFRRDLDKKEVVSEKDVIKKIQTSDIQEVSVRSIITCQTENGVCAKCYGKDLGTNKEVDMGTTVGIIAAQSIGEPGTQLTMRTFHMGGVAEGSDITQGLTRVEELFEARAPKSGAIISEIEGKVSIQQKGKQTELIVTSHAEVDMIHSIAGEFIPTVKVKDKVKKKMIIARTDNHKGSIKAEEDGIVTKITDSAIIIQTEGRVKKLYKVPSGRSVKVINRASVAKGQALTDGHLNLRQLMELTDTYTVQKYIVNEVQGIYASQGQSINDKHIELIARQMLSKVRLLESGDSQFLPGEIVDHIRLKNINAELKKKGKKESKFERLLLGLTRVSLYTDSWLSAASFQETIRVLVEASTTNKLDTLDGLKENVIIGKLIPAGEIYKRKRGLSKILSYKSEGKLDKGTQKNLAEKEDYKTRQPII